MGVEGGGTKSEAILTDESLKILMQRKGRALNYHDLGKDAVRRNFTHLIAPLLARAKAGKVYAVLGSAGIDTAKDEAFYKKLMRSALPRGSVFDAVNDSKIALEARCPGEKNGILVIAGTGSNVYGESDGKVRRCVGWGFALGDEGSAYYFALAAMKAATRAWDGRGDKTVLEELLLKKAHVKTMEDFVPHVYAQIFKKKQDMKPYIASYARIVDRAIGQNDAVAERIRDEGARELGLGVKAVSERLGCRNKEFCLGVIGSVWRMPGLEEVFRKEVGKHCPYVRFSDNKDPGAWGAILLAKKLYN